VRSAVSLPLSPSNPHVHATYYTANNVLKRSRNAWYARRDLVTLKEELISRMMREMTRKMMNGKKKSKRDTHLVQIYWQKG